MGIERTKLNEEKIKNILKREYGMTVSSIEKIERGTSNLFKINANNKNYILKEFISKRKKETIFKEIDIINFLKQKNINVPKYVKTSQGDYYTQNEGRIIIVQEYIDGYTIENNSGEYKQVIECANILGKLIKAFMDYPELSDENIIEEYFSKKRINTGIEKMRELKNKIKEDNIYKEQIIKDLNYRIKMLNEIKNNFDFDIINKMTLLNCHGDFCSQQLIYQGESEPVIIDFEKAKKMPVAWEVIRSYCYIDKNVKNGDIDINLLTQYFREFMKYIKLNEYDLKYVSYIYLLQLASSTFGYKEYIEDYSQKELIEFAFFRTKLCKNLYERRDKISMELEESILKMQHRFSRK